MSSRFFRYDPVTNQVVEVAKTIEKQIPRYPLPLESLAVHPSQIPAAREFAERNGVKTDYTPDGRPVMRDPGHYRKFRKLNGVHFKNGYTS